MTEQLFVIKKKQDMCEEYEKAELIDFLNAHDLVDS